MERLFETHRLRRSAEALPVWKLTAMDPGGPEGPMKVIVPGVWESIPTMKNYRGRAAYEQEIVCGGNVRLWLGGVSFRAKVLLDDREVAAHYGAYTGFEAVIPDVPEGCHRLCIEADNRYGEDSALHIPNDYYSYGGVNRPVVIEQVSDTYISAIHVTPRREGSVWHARAEVRLRTAVSSEHEWVLRVCAAGVQTETRVEPDGTGDTVVTLDLTCPDARMWSPDDPVLTQIAAILLADGQPVDDLIDRFGFREVRTEGTKILINGEPLRIKGFNRHEDFNDYGVSAPVEAMMRDLQLMRGMGANCVRTCHYPNDPRFLDLCDELGMLVWEEAHARGLNEQIMRNPNFMPQQEQCVREMIDQHFNHPSIFIWGCLNECADDTEYGADCYRRIFRLLHELDASRPMTAALLERMGCLVGDESDVVSINIYPQWYHGKPVDEALKQKLTEMGKNKPVIVSEIGAGAIPGFHDPFGEAKWSEERQASILRGQIQSVLGNPDCTGLFLWQFADVRVDESWFSSRPRTMNNKGVVDEYRRPKLAYMTVKELFHRL